jgi:NMD protein affecting ribosome stability and mRNA decay
VVEVNFDEEPEHLQAQSFRCDCGGLIEWDGKNWVCDKCDFERENKGE